MQALAKYEYVFLPYCIKINPAKPYFHKHQQFCHEIDVRWCYLDLLSKILELLYPTFSVKNATSQHDNFGNIHLLMTSPFFTQF